MAGQALGRHVVERSGHERGGGQFVFRAAQAGGTKIDDHCLHRFEQNQIFRFEIAMDDASGVHIRERGAQLPDDARRAGQS